MAVLIRGDREVNEVKLANHLDVEHLELAERGEGRARPPAPRSASPARSGSPAGVRAGRPTTRCASLTSFAAGANKADAHLVGVNWGRDCRSREFADLAAGQRGRSLPALRRRRSRSSRGIEVGHIFKLGTKYSRGDAAATSPTRRAREQPMIMGCYGLGIGRTVAAAIEQNHDADGIIWPLPLAPFEVLVHVAQPRRRRGAREPPSGIYGRARGAGRRRAATTTATSGRA